MRFSKRILAMLAVIPLVVSNGVSAQKSDSADAMLRMAADKAAVDGDLNAAIRQYEGIVTTFSKTDRRAAATALVQMAACYQKLGDVQARKLYEQVVRDFSDQRETVALARERLELLGRGRSGLLTERVWIPEPMEFSLGGRVSPDGRSTLLTDWTTNNVALRDLTAGTVRRVTSDGSTAADAEAYPGASTFSPDGRRIAYGWYLDKTGVCVLRVVSREGGAPRTLYANQEIISIDPHDWSADGQLIAVSIKRRDRTAQIGIVRVLDGSLVVLKSVDWSGVGGLRFSPDSQAIAYHRPGKEGSFDRDVFVISVDGSREVTAASGPSDDIMLEWTPDGARLLIGSDRGGAMGLWATRVRDAARALELVKADLGDIASAGLTRAGALYYRVQPARAEIYVASFDPAAGQLASKPAAAIQQFRGQNTQPEWSSDGRSLLYVSRREVGPLARPIFIIQSIENGSRRELHPSLSYGGYARWSPDGSQLLVRGADLKGRSGILTVNTTTEETKLVASEDVCSGVPFWDPSGTSFFCFDFGKHQIVEVDSASGSVRRTFPTDGQGTGVSPDGRFLVYGSELPTQKGVRLLQLSDGTSRNLIQLTPPNSQVHNWGTVTWTPDGRAVAFFGVLNGDTGLWWVPIDGTLPHKLNVDAKSMGMVRFSAKTGQMVFATDAAPRVELWKMENFLPSASK